MPSLSSIVRMRKQQERDYFRAADSRSNNYAAEYSNSAENMEDPWTVDGDLRQLPIFASAKNRDSSHDIQVNSVNLDTCNDVSRTAQSSGSFVDMEPSEFWKLPVADQKIILSSLCRATGATSRMAMSKTAGNSLKVTINNELYRQARECRRLRNLPSPSDKIAKGPVKRASKDAQKAAQVKKHGGVASFKGATHRIRIDHISEAAGATIHKLNRSQANLLEINHAVQTACEEEIA